MSKRRVVVTGLGMLSPVGHSAESSWQALLQGQSGITNIDHFDTADFPTKFAGLVKDFDPEQFGISRKDQDEFANRSHHLAAAATKAGRGST